MRKITESENTAKPFALPLVVSALFAAVLSLSACNTIEGAGRDVESIGDEIEDSAD